MKISESKKQLAKIISENGGWRDGAKFAAQGGNYGHVGFASEAPVRKGKVWDMTRGFAGKFLAGVLLPNWHQTILSRDEYFNLYPATDADGWIEWKGGLCPVDIREVVDIQYRVGTVIERADAGCFEWQHYALNTDIIAYRPHKPESEVETPKPERVVIEQKPTIEQLAAEYRNRLDYAERKQQEAAAAKAEAEAKLAELVAEGKAVGLEIFIAKEADNA